MIDFFRFRHIYKYRHFAPSVLMRSILAHYAPQERTPMLEQNLFENIRFAKDYPFALDPFNRIHTFPCHWHNFAEMLISKSDGIEYRIEDDSFVINKGDFVLIHPCQLHELIYSPDLDNSYYLLQFNYSLLMNLPTFRRNRYLLHKLSLFHYEWNPTLADLVQKNAQRMCDLYLNEEEDFSDASICSCLYAMFAQIGSYIITDDFQCKSSILGSSRESGSHSNKIHQSLVDTKMIGVCSYLSQNCTQPFTLEQAADYAGFSKYHFSRVFHEFTGTSFQEFLSLARLNVAGQLLADSSLSITDIALQSGFNSISSFNRCFQKYKNTTPTLFRSQYLKEESH